MVTILFQSPEVQDHFVFFELRGRWLFQLQLKFSAPFLKADLLLLEMDFQGSVVHKLDYDVGIMDELAVAGGVAGRRGSICLPMLHNVC